MKVIALACFSLVAFLTVADTSYAKPSHVVSPPSSVEGAGSQWAKTQFISYWASWSQGNSSYQYTKLSDIPDGVNQVFVAFALEKDSAGSGLTLQLPEGYDAQWATDVKNLRSRGIKVILSTGGAWGLFPWDNTSLSTDQLVKQYENFMGDLYDGIDFDVEEDPGHPNPNILRVKDIAAGLKKDHPEWQITDTVAVGINGIGTTGNVLNLAKSLVQAKLVTYLNIMNYDVYWAAVPSCYSTWNANAPNSNCYVQTIHAVEGQLQSWGVSSDDAKAMISNGMMIGKDDSQLPDYTVSVELAQEITSWLAQNNYGAVMTWALTRDQPQTGSLQGLDLTTGLSGSTAPPPKAYTNALVNTLKSAK